MRFSQHKHPPSNFGKRLSHPERLEPRLALAAQAVGSAFLVNDVTEREQSTETSSQAVAVSSANRIVVFEGKGAVDDHGIFAEVFNASGTTTLASFQINTTREGDQHSAAVAVDASGNFVVTWAGRGVGDKAGVFFRRYSANGTALGGETLVNTTTGGEQIAPAIAMATDGSFAIAWSGVGTGDASGVFLRRYSAAGVAAGNEVRLNTTVNHEQIAPSIAFDATGNMVAAWASRNQDGSDWAIVGQRLNATGVAQGTEFVINTTTTGSQTLPDVAIDPTGGFLVAWQSFGQDGAGWGIVGRRFTAAGAADGAEFIINNITAGQQQDVSVAFTTDGQLFSSWTSGTTNGHGWEVQARSYTAAGVADGVSFTVNLGTTGVGSGRQHAPFVAVNGNDGLIVWSGNGATDHEGVYAQRYDLDADTTPQQAPNLAAIADGQATAGTQFQITVTATDPNPSNTLTFTLDVDDSPTGATITQTNNNTAIIRWTPTTANQGTTVNFRVLVTDNGVPVLTDAEDFQVTVAAATLTLDLNGTDELGNNTSASFVPNGGAVSIVDDDLAILVPNGGTITSARAQFSATPNGTMEFLTIDTLNTSLVPIYSSSSRTLTLTGTDTAENYARVLRTLRYNNTAFGPSGGRTVSISVNSGATVSNVATSSIEIAAANLVAFAQALSAAGAKFFGAGWSAETTSQREVFEDGGQFLPFVEVTNPNRTPNQTATDNNITTYPTWVFSDGSRLVGVQTLQALSDHTGIDISLSTQPFLAPLPSTTLLIGSPLHVPLDGYDPNGGPLTYTVTTNNAGVTAQVQTGNRSARINVAGFGEMVFELFEDRASRATSRMIELAEDDFYEDIIFHRVINNFVIQGGDPTGTGSGGSPLPNFDDQFHPDLQHNRSGLLSMAKTSDDTNDSQFFITERATRNLDFNHTIFGLMVEGESVRDAISNTAVNASDRPTTNVVMEGIDIFEDQENAVVLLKAAPGTTGPVTVTVTVADQNGNTFERTFQVTVAADNTDVNANSPPFLGNIVPVSVNRNTVAQVQLTATDVESDQVFFTAQRVGSVNYNFTVSATGLLQVTPPQDFVGTIQILVGVGKAANAPDDTQLISIQFV
ncbi:MAG: peptidylprolyl isomerase [Bythopirellula sp.]|nr:peptidylprolyl isomerase [Bythopirellula sp.]